jgi:hypothetical protein
MLARPHRPIADAVRHAWDDLWMLARLTRDVPAFYREPITLDAAVAWQRERLATREQRLVRMAEEQVYSYPKSPYLHLLRSAGCELGDFRALVTREGVEGALEHLMQRGVYVTFEELKGRCEAVRGSRRFRFAERDFDNPRTIAHFGVLTGGTGGRRSRVLRSLPLAAQIAHCVVPALDAHGLLHVPQAVWMDGPIDHLLRNPKMRIALRAWFYPLAPLPWSVRLGGLYLAGLARLAGQRLPLPARCDLHQPGQLAGWLVEQRRQGPEICLVTTVSAAVRVAAAATAAGLSLEGVVFYVRSEPYTEARQRTIEASGARAVVLYGSQEASSIGLSCATPQAPDDVHVFDSRYGLVQRARRIGEDGPEIAALLVSTLSEHAAKTLLNVETGDFAEVERRDCGCKLGALSLRTHLANVRSFEKLTGEGMTFARTNLMHVVEAILPARFGGTSIDYQVVEDERPGGLPRLALRVCPSVGPLDEVALRTAFLEALARDGELERYMASFWERANTIEVERRAPLVTPAGKVLPFQLVRAGSLVL